MLINRRAFVGSSAATLLLPGCVGIPDARSRQGVPLESLIRQMKYDVGSYIFEHQNDEEVPFTSKPCAGDVNFSIQKVKMTVTATFDRSAGASGGLEVPIGLVTLQAKGSASRKLTDTVTTTLSLFPITAGRDAVFDGDNAKYAPQRLTAVPPPSPDFQGTPIRDALNGLRNDLLKAADTAPCFNFGDAGAEQDNIVRWGFTIENKRGGSGGFSILVFSIGAEESATTTYANTLEASFIASGDGAG